MEIPETLQNSLRAGKVIPFVGAGVSMSVLNDRTGESLFPSWRELLLRAAARLEKDGKQPESDIVRGLVTRNRPDYLEAARYAREGFGEADWYTFLKAQFDLDRELVRTESLRLPEAIWKLNSKLVITTNYDDVLRWALPPNSYPQEWDIEAPAEMAVFLRGEMRRPAIWYLHGRIHNASKIILAPEDYGLLYPEAEDEAKTSYEAALATLHTLLSTHTFLFIGFSLNDAYFGKQLERIKRIYQGANASPYVLVHKDQARDIHLKAEVKVITFEDYAEGLLDRLNELAAIANNKATDTTPPTKEPEPPQEPPKQAEPPTPQVADYNPNKSVFFVPFRQKGNQVIGREDALQAVRQQLTEGRRTAIGQTAAFQGLGGLGKTQLAVEYAYRFQDTYPNGVIWLNADQDIAAQLTELADKAGWIAPQSEHKYKLDVARHRLRTYSDCLIIFDNLESPETIENYLPEPQATPHILVTSRIDQPDFNPIDIDPLDEALSFELLVQEAGREPVGDEEERATREIAEALDGLPLALELAGAYLRHRRVSWQQYRDLLNHNLKAAFLPGKLSTFTKRETDLYSTLKVNDEIFEEEPKLKEILDLLTWSGTAPMGQDLMRDLLNVENPFELTNAFGLGTTLRLLQKSSDGNSYSIHRLVGKVRREDIPLQGRLEWVDDICRRIGDWFEERREHFSELLRFEAEIDHLRAWQENARKYAPKHSSRLVWLQAYPSYHRGHYQETKKWIEKALELFEQGNESDLKLRAYLFNDLGRNYFFIGDYKRSLEYAKKALEIQQQLFGERNLDTATSLNNVSATYEKLGDYKRSLEYAKKALEIQQQLFGERNPNTVTSFNNIGLAYNKLGDYKRSLEYFETVLEIQQELFGERHPNTATSLNNVGMTYGQLGDYKRNLEYVEKALKLEREILGDKHPDTILSVHNLVALLANINRHQQAFSLLEEFLSQLSKDHIHYDLLKKLEPGLLSKAIRPGFRQPSSKSKGRKGKGKKRKH